MQRFIALLLIWILPIQFGLAATVDVREHINGGHSHNAALHERAAHDEVADATHQALTNSSHVDCGACHFFHSLALTAPNVASVRPAETAVMVLRACASERLPSARSARPERPKWIAFV
jgi:hypothetical protein